MRAILASILLVMSPAAFAQSQPPSPQQQAQQQIEQLIGSLIIANTTAQAQIADLKKQLEDAKKPAVPEPSK